MDSVNCFMILVTFLGILTGCQFNAQQSPGASTSSARSLDALLQDYAYRAFVRPRTGVIYPAQVPSNLSAIKVSVIRLRSGSMRSRGLRDFNEFDIPAGVVATPFVVRLALVYQNLGNWSSVYYPLPDYAFITPVVGLLAYSAANLSATNLPELGIVASANPISIKFMDASLDAAGQTAKCVHFHLNGSHQITDLMPGNLCTTRTQGHFAVVANSTALAPSPAPSGGPMVLGRKPSEKGKFEVWKIVVAVIGGFLGLILLPLLLLWLHRCRWNRKMKEMVNQSETGEVLKAQRVGNAQLPVAPMVRTRPVLENEYRS